MAKLSLRLLPKQLEFLKAAEEDIPVVLALAGIKGGKSSIGAYTFTKRLYSKPNRSKLAWIVAPTYDMSQVAERKFVEITHSLIKNHNIVHRVYFLQNPEWTDQGFRVEIKSADRSGTMRGASPSIIWADEPAQMDESAFTIMLGRLLDSAGQLLMTGTPEGLGYLYDRVWVPFHNGDPAFRVIRWTTHDNCRQCHNGFLDHDVIERIREQYGHTLAQQELDAEFVSFKGLVWKYDRADIVDEVPPPEKMVRSLAGIDFGWNHPFAAVYVGRDRDQTWWVLDELFGSETPINTWGERLSCWKKKRAIRTFYAETADPESRQDLAKWGVVTSDAKKDRDAGISYVGGQFEQHKIKIHRRCHNLIHSLDRYQWPQAKNGIQPTHPVKAFDDLPDALRYCLWSEHLSFDRITMEKPKKLPAPLDARGARMYTNEQLDFLADQCERRRKLSGKSLWPRWYSEDKRGD